MTPHPDHQADHKPSYLSRHIRLIQFLGIAVCLPALVSPSGLPRSLIIASLIGIGLMALLGAVITEQPFPRTPLDIPIWLLGLVASMNLLISADPARSLAHVTTAIAGIAAAYAIAGLLIETHWFTLSGWAICLLGLLIIPLVLLGTNWSGTSKLSWIPWTITKEMAEDLRAAWTPADYDGFNVNLAGGTLALLLPVPVAYALFSRRITAKVAAVLESLLVGTFLLFTQSRGAILGVVVAIGVMLANRNWRWLLIVALIGSVGVYALQKTDLDYRASQAPETDWGRAVNSAKGRFEIWSRGIYAAQDHPFTGIGMGLAMDVISHRYPYFNMTQEAEIEHLHSLYFNTLAETGIPGLIALLAFLLGLLALLWSTSKAAATDHKLKPLILGLLGTTIVICIHGVTDTVLFSPKAYILTWSLFGVAIAAAMYANQSGNVGVGNS